MWVKSSVFWELDEAEGCGILEWSAATHYRHWSIGVNMVAHDRDSEGSEGSMR